MKMINIGNREWDIHPEMNKPSKWTKNQHGKVTEKLIKSLPGETIDLPNKTIKYYTENYPKEFKTAEGK